MKTGCNYWAGHTAVNMWSDWNPERVWKELTVLADLGMERVRIFPLWSDFQPITIGRGYSGNPVEILYKGQRLPGSGPERHGVDPVMLDRFGKVLDMAHEVGLGVITGILTGWMSGRFFVPPALEGRGLITDPFAVRMELGFIHEIVSRFKDHPAIHAWSAGNETNCLQKVNRDQAWLWLHTITDAIRKEDQVHPVYSGMHGLNSTAVSDLEPAGTWTIQDNAESCDVLTVHPYALFTPNCGRSRPDAYRDCLHAPAESVYYSTIGNKPCSVEEYGTFAEMYLGNKEKEDYIRASLWNSYAAGSPDFLWWCACDHTFEHKPPYTWCSCERELGIMSQENKPFPFAEVFRDFNRAMAKMPERTQPVYDAVCVMTRAQDSWSNAYGCYLLARQAGLNLRFAAADAELPESKLYIVPGISGTKGLNQLDYEKLLKCAENGARVVFTLNDAVLSPSSRYWKFVPHYVEEDDSAVTVSGKDFEFKFPRKHHYCIDAGESRVLASADGEGICFEQTYGKGSIVCLTIPLEEYAATCMREINNPETFQAWKLYRLFAEGYTTEHVAESRNPLCLVTEFPLPDGSVLVCAVNNSMQDMSNVLTINGKLEKALYGSMEKIPHHNAFAGIFR